MYGTPRTTTLAIALSGAVAAGCVGTMEEKQPTPSSSSVDAGLSACAEPTTSAQGGHHNPGTDCLTCHSQTGAGPEFTIGGTLYDGVNSSTAVSGATIRVIDANGLELELITTDNGNFWTREQLAFPVSIAASLCPDTLPMISPVTETGGSCARGGCHIDTFRVYLP